MKLAILGGSFNPVHIGHLFLADEVLSKLNYDRVILVPAFQSPLKIDAGGALPQDRLEMLAASISGDPRLTIDECELNREGVSYTIETLIDIIERYRPEGKPGLIMGDDLVASFDSWQKPQDIAELVDFVIARREGPEALSNFSYPYRALNNEVMNVSSSLVREKIGKTDAWRYLVPSGARCIIEDRGLYGFAKSTTEIYSTKDNAGVEEKIYPSELNLANDRLESLEDEEMFLLFVNRTLIYIFPKRCLSEQQKTELSAYFGDKGI